MKTTTIIFAGMILLAACKEDETVYRTSTSVNVINMAVDGPSVKVNAGADNNFLWSKADGIGYGNNKIYGTAAGDGKSVIAVDATDTTKMIFNQRLNLQQRLNTLYITGQSPTIEGFFVEEKDIPFIQTDIAKPDSSVYVRFVNLSPNSTSLDIKLSTGTGNEVSGLAYKGITAFKKYAAKTTTANYVFEVRDAVTGTLRLSYTVIPNNVRHRTISLIIKGSMTTPATTGTNAFGITQFTFY